MRAFVCAGAGFLLAVLWMDLMFDVQVLRRSVGGAEDEGERLASIAAYYRRVTTTARPMNRLVAAAMVATIAGIVVEVARRDRPGWAGWASLALAVMPVTLATVRTVPNAVRLGTRQDSLATQRGRALAIGHDHLLCLAAITGLLVVQLAWAT